MEYIIKLKKQFETNLIYFRVAKDQEKIKNTEDLISQLSDLENSINNKSLVSEHFTLLKNILSGVNSNIEVIENRKIETESLLKKEIELKEELLKYLTWN